MDAVIKKFFYVATFFRPLRQLALVIPFPPTGSSKLASRLKEVAAAEDMRADLTALLTLCKKTDNDIRSCLSSLQFFRKRGRVLSSADVADLSVGAKDSQKSLFSVWDDVFAVPRVEGNRRAAPSATTAEGGACRSTPPSGQSVRFKHVLDSVASCGEYDRVITGQFWDVSAIFLYGVCFISSLNIYLYSFGNTRVQYVIVPKT